MKKKAIIVSIKGLKLTSREILLLSKEKPWGLILFKRNIKSATQIKKLIKSIRNYVKDKKFPILIDEEGSRVSRLRNIINHNFDANYFGNLYKINKKIAVNLYKKYLRILSGELKKLELILILFQFLIYLEKTPIKLLAIEVFLKKKKS